MKKITIFIAVISLFLSIIIPGGKLSAASDPSPEVSTSISSFNMEKGSTTDITFSVMNWGGYTNDSYFDVSFSNGLEVDYVSSSSCKRYPIGSKLFNAYSEEQDLVSSYLLYSCEMGSFDMWESRNFRFSIRGNSSGSQWMKYRASFRRMASSSSDPFIRYPSYGSSDQQGWAIKKVDGTVSSPSKINSVKLSPSTLEKSSSSEVKATIDIYVGNPGYIDVLIGNSRKGEYLSSSGSYGNLVERVKIDTTNYNYSTSYNLPVYVQFRPGATSGPLDSCQMGDIYWSGNYYFSVIPPPPSYYKPVLISPTNGQVNVSLNTTLYWSANGNPSDVSYKVFGGSNQMVSQGVTTGTSLSLPRLTPNTRYYWNVSTITPGGDLTSETWNFKTVAGQTPIANAGSDKSVEQDKTVFLDAGGSSDSDGSIVSYKWQEGSDILSNSKSFSQVFSIGTHNITLTVTDNDGLTNSDLVVVTVTAKKVYGIEVIDYISPLTNTSILGGYVIATPDNLLYDIVVPIIEDPYGYNIQHGSDGTVRLHVKNTGNTSDKYTISTNSSEDVRIGFPSISYVSHIPPTDPKKWDGGYSSKTFDFTLNAGEEKDIDVFLKTKSDSEIGSLINIPFEILSKGDSNKKIVSNIVYTVISKKDFQDIRVNQLINSITYVGETIVKFLTIDYDLIQDPEAEWYLKVIEGGMFALTFVPMAKGAAIEIKAIATGGKTIIKKVAVTEAEKIAMRQEAKAMIGKVVLEETERQVIKDAIGKEAGKVFIGKLSKDSKSALSVILRSGQLGDKSVDYIRALDKIRDAEGFEKFMVQSASNIDKANDFYFATKGIEEASINLVKSGGSVSDGLKIEKSFSRVVDGQTIEGAADALVVKSNGQKILYEFKNIDVTARNLEELSQIDKYQKLIKSGWEGTSALNTKIVVYTRSVEPGLEMAIKQRYGAKLVTCAVVGTGLSMITIDVAENSTVPDVVPNHAPGTYNYPVPVTLTDKNGRITDIYYTLDGTNPGFFSKKYNSSTPIIINKTTTIKYFAVDRITGLKSNIQSAKYIIAAAVGKKITITGENNQLLNSLMVSITKDGITYFMNQSSNGVVNIPDIKAGIYNLKIRKVGYKDLVNNIDLTGTTTSFSYKLIKDSNPKNSILLPGKPVKK